MDDAMGQLLSGIQTDIRDMRRENRENTTELRLDIGIVKEAQTDIKERLVRVESGVNGGINSPREPFHIPRPNKRQLQYTGGSVGAILLILEIVLPRIGAAGASPLSLLSGGS